MSLEKYSSINIQDFAERTPPEIIGLISGGSVSEEVINISSKYNIPVSNQTALSNVIIFILLGAVLPEDAVTALIDLVEVDEDTATNIATDLEQGIFAKAREALSLPQEEKGEEVKTLDYQGPRSKEELRKEIMDTTKRESGINKAQASKEKKKTTIITPGSRSQLLEQLQVIGSIPDDEEISERLKHIQEQIASLKKEEDDNTLKSNIALRSFMFGEKGKEMVDPSSPRPATYSIAPEKYNVDPYREVVD